MGALAAIDLGGGDENPPLFHLTFTKEELEYLFYLVESDYADMPEITVHKLLTRMSFALKGLK